MNKIRTRLTAILLTGLTALFCIHGCSSSDSTSATDDGGSSPSAELLSTYGDDMREVTPYLAESGFLDDWQTWAPSEDYGIFQKLLSDSAEGLFDPVDSLDDFIEIINGAMENTSVNDIPEDDPIEVTTEEGSASIDVDNTPTTVTVPFFGDTVEVAHQLTMAMGPEESPMGTLHLAFTEQGTEESLVAHFTFTENGETAVYYATRNTETSDVEVWCAMYAPKLDAGGVDPFFVQFKWAGNTAENWFKMSQVTNACGGRSQIMGGGSIAGDMAFISKNNETDAGATPYYVLVDMAYLNGDSAADSLNIEQGAPIAEQVANNSTLAYIDIESEECFGWLTDFPDAAEDIAWVTP